MFQLGINRSSGVFRPIGRKSRYLMNHNSDYSQVHRVLYGDPSLSSQVVFGDFFEKCVFAKHQKTNHQIVLLVLMLYKVSEPRSRTVSSDTCLSKIYLENMSDQDVTFFRKKKTNQFELTLTKYDIKELIKYRTFVMCWSCFGSTLV